jgi:hypothetical protein
MASFHPVEAFSWGQRAFSVDQVVPSHDPAVAKFPHLFVPVDGDSDPEVEVQPAPVKRRGRPPKAKPQAG